MLITLMMIMTLTTLKKKKNVTHNIILNIGKGSVLAVLTRPIVHMKANRGWSVKMERMEMMKREILLCHILIFKEEIEIYVMDISCAIWSC